MTKLEKRYKSMPDLTRIENGKSVSKKLESLLVNANIYRKNPQGLRLEFFKIIKDPETHISKEKIQQYENDMSKKFTFNQISQFITNIYMRGAKLGLN
jgi:hypothetical protein